MNPASPIIFDRLFEHPRQGDLAIAYTTVVEPTIESSHAPRTIAAITVCPLSA